LVTGDRFLDVSGSFVGTGYFKLGMRRALVAAGCARGNDRCVEADASCSETEGRDSDSYYPDDLVRS
jgi:hypothetical protein